MPILVICSNCAKQMQAPNNAGGKKVRCPKCQTMNEVPRLGAAYEKRTEGPSKEDEAAALEETPPPAQQRNEKAEREKQVRRVLFRGAPHRGTLILALGIIAIICALLPVAGLLMGVAVILMANTDRAKMEAGEMDPSGQSLVSAGKVCAFVGVGLSVLNGIFGAVLVLFFGVRL